MTTDTMYLLVFEHREKSRPLRDPIKLSYSIPPNWTIERCLERAIPEDDSIELVSCYIEIRFPPKSLRAENWKPGD